MLKLNFYSIAEKLPSPGQEIVLLKFSRWDDYNSFEPELVTVEAVWNEYVNGDETGNAVWYDADEGEPQSYVNEDSETVSYKLALLVDGFDLKKQEWFWMPATKFWKASTAAIEKVAPSEEVEF